MTAGNGILKHRIRRMYTNPAHPLTSFFNRKTWLILKLNAPMPNRILRDWTNSDKIDQLSFQAEVFFTRLIMKADDYGCYWADEKRLRCNLFVLKIDKIREADITRWMAECQKAGLIALYESESKKYLQIVDFNQRKRIMSSQFPPRQSDDGHMTVIRPPEEEVEREEEKKRERFSPPSVDDVLTVMQEKLDDFTAMAEASKFINHYSSNGWMVGKNKMKDWKAAVHGWISRMQNYQPVKKQIKTADEFRREIEEREKQAQ